MGPLAMRLPNSHSDADPDTQTRIPADPTVVVLRVIPRVMR